MRTRKKIVYYVLGVLAIFSILILGGLRAIGDRDRVVSVIWSIVHLPKEILWESSSWNAFDAGFSIWLYTLVPLVCVIPSVSDIYGEITSRFYMGVELRRGRYRYIYSRFLYSAVSGALTAAAGILVYAAFVCMVFPLNPVNADAIWGYEQITTAALAYHILLKVLYVGLYGMAMSVIASFFVFLYPNLYVDLSALFVVSNVLRSTAGEEKILFPLAMTVGMSALYAVMWKGRNERI